jgi:hypothetical protein
MRCEGEIRIVSTFQTNIDQKSAQVWEEDPSVDLEERTLDDVL